MGEIADMMIDGTMCQCCGVFLHDGHDGPGYPGYCPDCQPEDAVACTKDGQARPSKTNCPTCGKLVKKTGVADHMRDVHGVIK